MWALTGSNRRPSACKAGPSFSRSGLQSHFQRLELLSYKIVLIHLLFWLLFQVPQLIIQKSIFLFQRTTFA